MHSTWFSCATSIVAHNEYFNTFDFIKIGISNFIKAYGIPLRIIQQCWIPIFIIICSNILIFLQSSSTFLLLLFIILVGAYIALFIDIYYYKISYFVAFDNPSISCKLIVLKSKRIMLGNRFSLFILELKFALMYIILGIVFFFLSRGIPTLFLLILSIASSIFSFWLNNYLHFAKIAFYEYYRDLISINKAVKSNSNNDYSSDNSYVIETNTDNFTESNLMESKYEHTEENLENFDTFDIDTSKKDLNE